MSLDKNDKKYIYELRERRKRSISVRENAKKRAECGQAIVGMVNAAMATDLTLEDFDVERSLPVQFGWEKDFRKCRGLTAAYVDEERMRAILSCCDDKVGQKKGIVSFGECSFIGTTEIDVSNLVSLSSLAKSINDSVLFCPKGLSSVLLVDFYEVKGDLYSDYSIVVQGGDLEQKLSGCFISN